MKVMKFAAAAMALTMAASGMMASGLSASAFIDTTKYSNSQFSSHWKELLQQERSKFPEIVNGKQCYWNGGNVDGYTTTPCNHNGQHKCNSMSTFYFYNSKDYSIKVATDMYGNAIPYRACMAFALKLQKDIFQTNVLVRFELDANGYYTLPDGTKKLYIPRDGDAVRLSGHSIFLTNTASNPIQFAQCNADDKCSIDWDATQYKGQTVTTAFLQKNAEYVDRPVLEGDLNLDGIVNSKDASIFKSTVMTDGSFYHDAPLAMYDINNDNFIDPKDYNLMSTMSQSAGQSLRYANGTNRTITSRYNHWNPANSFVAGGAFYEKIDSSSVGFVGLLDRQQTSFTVPSTVKDPTNGKVYTVTEIGFNGREPATKCMECIETITLPTTIKTIRKGAFFRCPLNRITIPKNSQLTTICDSAFSGTKLIQVDLSNATKLVTMERYAFGDSTLRDIIVPYSLETIGERAFNNCNGLLSFRTATDSSGNSQLKRIEDYAFAGCKHMEVLQIENNVRYAITFGSSAGIFDSACKAKLYLPNTTSVAGVAYFEASDINLFKNGSMKLFCGKYRVYDEQMRIAGRNDTTAFKQITVS